MGTACFLMGLPKMTFFFSSGLAGVARTDALFMAAARMASARAKASWGLACSCLGAGSAAGRFSSWALGAWGWGLGSGAAGRMRTLLRP